MFEEKNDMTFDFYNLSNPVTSVKYNSSNPAEIA